MENENIYTAPVGVVLIATFWICSGAISLSITSGYLSGSSNYSVLGIIPLMVSIGIILIGWGLLTLKRWAFTISLVFSVLGSISVISTIPGLIYTLIGGLYYYYGITSFLPFISLLFIPMTWYLFTKEKAYFRKEEKPTKICQNCARAIPFDAFYCPYCDIKLEPLI